MESSSSHPPLEPLAPYIEAVPATRRARLLLLIDLIRQHYPGAKVSLRYRMPTFELEAGWVAVANQKHYISLYTCKPEHIQTFKAAHPDIKTGKGCINFRDRDDIPLDAAADVIHCAMTGRAGGGT